MEKKWWYIRGGQAQLLLLLLCFTQPAFAKSASAAPIKKSKPSAISKPQIPSQLTKKTSLTTKTPAAAHPNAKSKGAASRVGTSTIKQGRIQKSKPPGNQLTRRTFQATGKRPPAVILATRKGKKVGVVHAHATASQLAKARRVLIDNNPDATELLTPYSPELAPFPAQLNAERLAYRINSVFVLPGEALTLNIGGSWQKNEYVLQTALDVTQSGPNTWSWSAPRAAGIYPVKFSRANWGAAIQLNVIVMVPFDQLANGSLNGYRIGNYPTIPLRQLSAYTLPRGFIEVTEANENTFVSPHFRLRQFLCKQESSYPKYMVLDSRLLVVLETILKKVNEKGLPTPTLSIMSGYRTPYYNRAIGNATTYSRHTWGDAADIFVDAHPRDGEMDDLNGDGNINIHDTEILYDIVSDLYEPRIQRFLAGGFFNEPILQQLIANGYTDDQRLQRLMTGGLARYRETGSHGPFVHVDVRGIFTRWGR